MTRTFDDSAEAESMTPVINRRRALQLVGGSVVGVSLASGTASAHQFQFYGCSQVCTDTDGNRAVVATDSGYECRPLDRYDPDQTSDRQNQEWKWTSACYEVSEGEAIVGVLEDCSFCVNPNNCASNYYDDVDDIISDLNASGSGCGGCTGGITEGVDCDAAGTGGGRGAGNGGGKGNGKASGSRGRGR